jgi:hypothetical protein
MQQALNYLAIVYAWCLAHPEIVVPAIVYIAYNVIPRTPPKDRRLFALWALAERLLVLSWDRWGGSAKALGIVSPDPTTWSQEKPTSAEGKRP